MRCKCYFSTISLIKLLIFVACCLEYGCSEPQFVDTDVTLMPRKVAGTADAAVIMLPVHLEKRGVKIITIGQDYLISIPAVLLFTDQSSQLTWQSYDILNEVVVFLKQFRKITVHVTSYSMRYLAVRREKSLTLARANVVANYLWSQGINSRLIFAAGVGSDKPIIAFPAGGDRSMNSRIEITFRDVII